MDRAKPLQRKIILLGSFAVGKTSLSNRFVQQRFSNEYVATEGVHIGHRTIDLPDANLQVRLTIWDIADITTATELPEAYLSGLQGMLWILDLSRPASWKGMMERIDAMHTVLPGVPYLITGNKKDLVDRESVMEQLRDAGIVVERLVSAKTGEGVEDLFRDMARLLVSQPGYL